MSGGGWSKIAKKLSRSRADKVAVVRLDGPIGSFGPRHGLTAQSVEPVLRRAFDTEHLAAVVILIDSPGGSPAQSEYIAERIRQLASEKGVPVLAFCEDVAASGGYWIACAADEIYAAHTSLVGSIGVVSQGFGFADLLDRFGVQRRVYTAGDNKSRLDPFSPEQPADVDWLRGIQGDLHGAFIAWVRQRRGRRLAAPDDRLFTGDLWVGSEAASLGLVDGIGVMRSVIAERYPDAEITVIEAPKPLLARLTGGQLSAGLAALMEPEALTERVVSGALAAVDRAAAMRVR